jgi:hypothetical protein
MRDEIAADALRIPVRPPREPQLELVVDDGDNPPLELEGVTAVFAELPWIYFEAQPGPVTVRYGDPRAAAPNYDLEALRGAIPATPSTAVWRSQPPVTLAPEPEGLPMPETGSAIALDGFAFVRDIPAGPAGLIAVPLDAAVMAHSGIAPRRLKDVRVIDRAGMQVPYLLEKRDEPLIVDVTLEQRALPDGVSAPGKAITSYVVQLPYRELPDARLVLSTRARVFRRSVTLSSVEPAAERRPARLVRHDGAAWTHADEALPAPSLTFPLPVSVRGDVFLLVDEGDNQPLPIDTVKILLPSYALRFSRRPDLPLRMVYGHDQLEAPRYDLQLLAPRVLGRRAEEIQAGPEQPANAVATTLAQTVPAAVFWAVLALAVIVLLGLVVGLMRREAA